MTVRHTYTGNQSSRAKKPTYKVIKGEDGQFALMSHVVGKSWGGMIDTTFENYVTSGTYEHCEKIRDKLTCNKGENK